MTKIERIIDTCRARGQEGATNQEICDVTGLYPSDVSSDLTRLVKNGVLTRTGFRPSTRTGNDQYVHRFVNSCMVPGCTIKHRS